MIEKVIHNKKNYALIVRKKFRKLNGVNFFTDEKDVQQFGYMKHKKNYLIKPHLHKKRLSKIVNTTEVLIIFKGILRVDFYDTKKKYLLSKKLYSGDIIMLISGGHGFKVLKNLEMVEVKQGPYILSKDKKIFNKTGEEKIRIR
jgi:hypothetical protein